MRPRFLLRDALGSVIKGTLARPWRTLLFCFVVSVSLVICGVVVHVATRQKHFYISFGCHHIASRFVLYWILLCVFTFFHSSMITSSIAGCGFTVGVMLCLPVRRMSKEVWRVSSVGLRVLRRKSCAYLWNLRQGSRLQHLELDSTRSVRVGIKRWAQKHELPSKLQFFPHTSANASSITRALRSPWPQRGVEFVARECCEHSFTIAARDPTWARRTKV